MNTIQSISAITKKAAPNLKKYTVPVCKSGTAEEVGIKLKDIFSSGNSESLRIGELINTGTFANVYELIGWKNSYIVRIVRDEATQKVPKFNPKELKSVENSVSDLVYKNSDNTISIRRRINGEPLHGKFWDLHGRPDKKVFFEYFNEVINLPDEYFSKYMDDIINLRKSGLDIDSFNPNNYLLDKKSRRINIIDLNKNYKNCYEVSIQDFYPFFDSKRIMYLIANTTLEERNKLADDIHVFLDRIVKIAKNKGLNLEMKKNNDAMLDGDFINALYYKEPLLFKLWLK